MHADEPGDSTTRPRRRAGQLQRHPHAGRARPSPTTWRRTRRGAGTPTSSSWATSTRTAGRTRSRRSSAPGTPTSSSSFIGDDGVQLPLRRPARLPRPRARHARRSPAQVTGRRRVAHQRRRARPVRLQRRRPRRRARRRSSGSRRPADSYEPDARRSSDHDPVVVGLDLGSLHVDAAVIVQKPRGGGSLRPVGARRRRRSRRARRLTHHRRGGRRGQRRRPSRLPGTTTCVSLTSKGSSRSIDAPARWPPS